MALCEMHFWSPSLEKQTAAMVIVPQGRPGPFPVLYLLHGLSDDHTMWTRQTSLERYVNGLDLMVVMPDGGRGFYTDAQASKRGAVESLIVKDLIGFIDGAFQTKATREGRAVAGLSMGGYGAAKLALKHPDLFCAGVSLSGAVQWGHENFIGDGDWYQEFLPIFGESPSGGENDIHALSEQIDRTKLPALRLDCGTEDFLIEANRDLHRHWEALNIPHEYQERPGDHNWDYWDQAIQDAMPLLRGSLRF